MSTNTNTKGWPIYQQNAQRTGRISSASIDTEYKALFSPLSLATQPANYPVIDSHGNILCVDSEESSTVYSVTSSGQLKWYFQVNQYLSSEGVAIGNDGIIYAAGTDLIGLTSESQKAQQKFSIAFDPGNSCAGPLAFSDDGNTLYVALKNSSQAKGSVAAYDISGSVTPRQIWKVSIKKEPCSGIAVSNDGTLYVGTTAGQLFQVSSSGKAKPVASSSGNQMSTPTIGADGVVHCLSTDSSQLSATLFAFNPAHPKGNQFTFQPMGRFHKTNAKIGVAISDEGNIYVCFESLYKLSWNAKDGYSQLWKGDDTTNHGRLPGIPVIDKDGSVVVCGVDNWLVSYKSDGTLLWNKELPSLSPALALTTGGSIIYFNNKTVCATSFGGNPLLNAIYEALIKARTLSTTKYKYPLSATSLGSQSVFSLVSDALGGSDDLSIVEGTLIYDGNELVLSGNGTWLNAIGVNIKLKFTVLKDVVQLVMTASFGTTFKMSQAIPLVSKSFWGRLDLEDFTVNQTSTTAVAASGWNAYGSVALSGSLAVAASLLTNPPSNVSLTGTISLDSNSNPNISLSINHVFSVVFGESWNFPSANLTLSTYTNTNQGLVISGIVLSTKLTVAGHKTKLYATIPETMGLITLSAEFERAISISNAADMIFWPGGNPTAFKAALPNHIANQTSLGLKGITATIIPSTKKVSSAGISFTAQSYTAFSIAENGVSMNLNDVDAYISVIDPLSSSRTYSVEVSGQIQFKAKQVNVLTVNAKVIGPDWEISGKTVPETSISPVDAITALGGNQELPINSPSTPFTYATFSVRPSLGIYEVRFLGSSSWTLFQIGSFSAILGSFSLAVNRFISNPTTSPPTGTISVNLLGQLTIAGVRFDLGGYVTSEGNWQFYASLGSYMQLPTIGQLADALSSNLSESLPTSISSLGSNIVVNQLNLNLANGHGHNSLTLGLATKPGWEGWHIFALPFNLTLKDALTVITLDSSTEPKAKALVQATFELGSAGVRLQVPLPYSSDQFVIRLIENQQGVTVPTVGDIIGLVSSNWSSMLPEAITNLGSNIVLNQFEITRTQEGGTNQPTTTAFTFMLAAKDSTERWSPLGISSFALSGLRLGGSISKISNQSKSTIEGNIEGVVHIGNHGRIPLVTTFQNSFDDIVLKLNKQQETTLPTIKDIINLFSNSWGNVLPSAVTSSGQNLNLTEFKLQKQGNQKSVNVAVGSGSHWAPIIIGGANWITFQSYSFLFQYNSLDQPSYKGSLGLLTTLFGEQFTITASMPNLLFQVSHKFTSLNLKTICESLLGATSVPKWLENVGLHTVTVTVNFKSPIKISISTTVGDIDMDFLGTLSNIELSAEFGGGKSTRVCLSGIWNPPGGISVPGTFCYPFNSFKFKNAPNKKIDLPEDPKSEPANNPEPINSGSPGAVSSSISAFVAGGAGVATAVASGMISWIFGGNNSSRQNQTGAPQACAAGAVQYYKSKSNDPVSKENLIVTLTALKQCFPQSSAQDLVKGLIAGATQEKSSLSPQDVAFALVSVYTKLHRLEIAQILHDVYPEANATNLATYLAFAKFSISQTSRVLLYFFPSKVTTVREMLTALKGGYPNASNSKKVKALQASNFNAQDCIAYFQGQQARLNDLASWLASAGYSPVASGIGFDRYYATQVQNTTQMASVMSTAFQSALTSKDLWTIFNRVGYKVSDVLTTMKFQYPTQYSTITTLAAGALNAGYRPEQISGTLLNLFAKATTTQLIQALKAGDSSMKLDTAMLALNQADVKALKAATTYMDLAKSLWSQTPGAQNLADVFQEGEYNAISTMQAEKAHFSASISTPLAACKILHIAGYSRNSASKGLIFYFGNTQAVQSALTGVYGS